MRYPAKTNVGRVVAAPSQTQTMALPQIQTSPHPDLHLPKKKRSPQERPGKSRCQLGNPRMTKVGCSLFRVGCQLCGGRCSLPYGRRTRKLGRILNSAMEREGVGVLLDCR